MSWSIVEDPYPVSGPEGEPKYAVWDSIVDSFIATDATMAEVRRLYLQREAEKARDAWDRWMEQRKAGLVRSAIVTFEEGVVRMAEVHGPHWWDNQTWRWE